MRNRYKGYSGQYCGLGCRVLKIGTKWARKLGHLVQKHGFQFSVMCQKLVTQIWGIVPLENFLPDLNLIFSAISEAIFITEVPFCSLECLLRNDPTFNPLALL